MRQFSRFLAVGVFNTLLGYAVIFACMYLAGMSPELSNVSGYAVGLVASFLLNRHYTFRSSGGARGEVARFLVVFLVAYCANFIVLLVLTRSLDVHEGASQVLAGVLYVIVSYLMNKHLVFRAAALR